MDPEILDTVNSCFFFATSLFVWANVFKLCIDKKIKGVGLIPAIFFSISTCWGIYYYYRISQYLSLLGISLMAMANTVWAALAVYYTFSKHYGGRNG